MNVLNFGELLLRLSTQGHQRIPQAHQLDAHYGGAEANVAVGLAQLGINSSYFTVVPQNDLTHTALSRLAAQQVNTTKVSFQEGRLGIYFLELGKGIRPSKVVYDRAYSALSMIDPSKIDWEEIFEGIGWFNWSGITPAISQSAALLCQDALAIAEKKGINISVDLNYRSKLWQYGKTPQEIMPSLIEKCDYIFGGIDAPETYFGIVPKAKKTVKGAKLTDEDIISISEQLLDKFPKAQLFSTTLRDTITSTHNQLQGVVFTSKQLYKSALFDIPEIVDRVGGGDAFMAGLIAGLIKYGQDHQKVVNYATANSVWKHSIAGDYNVVSEEEILSLMEGGMAVIAR